jgi:hypothetical protein
MRMRLRLPSMYTAAAADRKNKVLIMSAKEGAKP